MELLGTILGFPIDLLKLPFKLTNAIMGLDQVREDIRELRRDVRADVGAVRVEVADVKAAVAVVDKELAITRVTLESRITALSGGLGRLSAVVDARSKGTRTVLLEIMEQLKLQVSDVRDAVLDSFDIQRLQDALADVGSPTRDAMMRLRDYVAKAKARLPLTEEQAKDFVDIAVEIVCEHPDENWAEELLRLATVTQDLESPAQ